jgi:hypothetical protein
MLRPALDGHAVFLGGFDVLAGDPVDILPERLFRGTQINHIAAVRGGVGAFGVGAEDGVVRSGDDKIRAGRTEIGHRPV